MSYDDLDGLSEGKRGLSAEEIQSIVSDVKGFHEKEHEYRDKALNESDEDVKTSHMEDAYLYNFKKIMSSRRLSKEEFDKVELSGILNVSYEELEVPLYEDYWSI